MTSVSTSYIQLNVSEGWVLTFKVNRPKIRGRRVAVPAEDQPGPSLSRSQLRREWRDPAMARLHYVSIGTLETIMFQNLLPRLPCPPSFQGISGLCVSLSDLYRVRLCWKQSPPTASARVWEIRGRRHKFLFPPVQLQACGSVIPKIFRQSSWRVFKIFSVSSSREQKITLSM